ncbi:MAG: T9SS type A sorting domain-containing protein [candidate division KSB1 bacterium]|nr:T9SS type A sorting domain-containing protein [candidate division KSB1 bacterium]MDZ7302774.1 T9SS type A sorting domain-containing protein [candidate division KSB1 bacterium]MDZ7310061.1 T9SS type A sorting domain-containing protein [candidate division KSB1 bacterium]
MGTTRKIAAVVAILGANIMGITYGQIRSDFVLAEEGKEPSVTLDSMGRLHATWVGGKGIKYGLFDSFGYPIQETQEFSMGSLSDSPRLDVHGDSVVIFWRRFFPGLYSSIAGTLFHATTGNIIGTFDNNKGDNVNLRPDVKFLSDSTVIAVWSGDGLLIPYPYTGVYGQLFTTSLDTINGLRLFNDDIPKQSEHSYARIATDQQSRNGVVVWRERMTASSSKVLGRLFSKNAAPLGATFLISDLPDSIDVWSPGVVMDAQGNFNVIWSTGKVSSLYGDVYLRRFWANGMPFGPSHKVNEKPGYNYAETDIAQDVDGRFVVVWEGRDKKTNIMAQRFSSDGSLIGGNFKVGMVTDTLNQYYPSTALRDGKMYTAWEELILIDSTTFHFNAWMNIIDFDDVPVSVKNRTGKTPEAHHLLQNYPNPFNPVTTIRFALLRSSHVQLIIYDALGNEIVTLEDREMLSGVHEVTWNAKEREVPSGVYVCQLKTNGYMQTRKMLLIR